MHSARHSQISSGNGHLTSCHRKQLVLRHTVRCTGNTRGMRWAHKNRAKLVLAGAGSSFGVNNQPPKQKKKTKPQPAKSNKTKAHVAPGAPFRRSTRVERRRDTTRASSCGRGCRRGGMSAVRRVRRTARAPQGVCGAQPHHARAGAASGVEARIPVNPGSGAEACTACASHEPHA